MPTFQPYGGWGWYISCLFPPSALSLFANVLIKVEAGGQGLHWDKLGISVTSESSFPFSARVVVIALVVDIFLYALLAAYLDRVRHQSPSKALRFYQRQVHYASVNSKSSDRAVPRFRASNCSFI